METPLQKLRKAQGTSKTWMAKQLGIHRVTYANYERGKSIPPKSVLFHIAHLLHVSPDELIHEIHG